MIKYLVAAALSLLPISAHAERYTGVMALAAMHPDFPCGEVLRTLDNSKRPALSVLYGTFGTDTTCINAFLDRYSNRPHFLNIYFENSTARRNRKVYAGELAPSYSVQEMNRGLERKSSLLGRSVVRRLNRVLALPIRYNQNTKAALTIGLEDNYSRGAWLRMAQLIRPRWPHLLFRNSLNDRNNFFPLADGIDRHTDGQAHCRSEALCMVSNDGTLLKPNEFADFFKRNRHADVVLAWEPQLQGRQAIDRNRFSFKPPRERSFAFDAATRRSLSRVLKNEP